MTKSIDELALNYLELQEVAEVYGLDYNKFCAAYKEAAMRMKAASPEYEADQGEALFVVFDGPPDRNAPRFVEVETAGGCSADAGEWKPYGDYWTLGPLYARPDPKVRELEEEIARLNQEKEYMYVEQVLHPIRVLIAVAQCAETMADNSEEAEGADGHIILGMQSDFDKLSDALDHLDNLPDDKPGYTLSGSAKAAWALRDLLGENYD